MTLANSAEQTSTRARLSLRLGTMARGRTRRRADCATRSRELRFFGPSSCAVFAHTLGALLVAPLFFRLLCSRRLRKYPARRLLMGLAMQRKPNPRRFATELEEEAITQPFAAASSSRTPAKRRADFGSCQRWPSRRLGGASGTQPASGGCPPRGGLALAIPLRGQSPCGQLFAELTRSRDRALIGLA